MLNPSLTTLEALLELGPTVPLTLATLDLSDHATVLLGWRGHENPPET